jgi:hypothetical protein
MEEKTVTAKKKASFMPNRLRNAPKIEPLPAGKPLAPYHVPALPPGKFTDVSGQLTLEDMSCIEVNESDDQDAA